MLIICRSIFRIDLVYEFFIWHYVFNLNFELVMNKIGFLFLLVFINSFVQAQQGLEAEFVDINDFDKKFAPNFTIKGWKGEMLPLIVKVKSNSMENVEFNITSESKNTTIKPYYMAYVLADHSAGYCGSQKTKGEFEISKIPDRAQLIEANKFKPDSTISFVFLDVSIGKTENSGIVPIQVELKQKGNVSNINVNIEVLNKSLPPISSSDYKIDFWQFPMSVADYYKIKPWSTEHFNYLEKMFEQLAGINQKVITATVFWDPYNSKIRHQSQMMIQVSKSKDGNYSYDYSNFERYVEIAMSKGITDQIALHNLYPWNNFYFYYDEASGKIVTKKAMPNSAEHHEFWTPFLKDFERYLVGKGWFDKLMFYVDERNPDITIELAKFIKGINSDYKVGYAGAFHEKLSPYVYDYSVPSNITINSKTLKQRQKKGFQTTLYTACFDKGANMLMTSGTIDTSYLMMLAKAKGYNGMLRWAFNLWGSKIMNNAIYSDVPSGDAHFVYPYNQPSLRYFLIKDGLEEILKIEQLEQKRSQVTGFDKVLDPSLLQSESLRIQNIEKIKRKLNE